MEQNIDLIDKNLSEIVKKEKTFNKLLTLNNYIASHSDFILFVNIRSLNANHNKLQVFIESLDVKPSVIICAETNLLEDYHIFTLTGYKFHYNKSKINKNDGVVIYIKDGINENTEIISVNKLTVLNTTIQLDKNKLIISSVYRSHDLPKIEFITNLKSFLEKTKKYKNHFIIGDFNIDILKVDNNSQKHLNNLLEKGFYPGFQTITRPSMDDYNKGSCIDNIFIKSDSIKTNTFKLETLFNDHYPLFISLHKL